MGYYRVINGIRWYYRLKPKQDGVRLKKGLFNDAPRHTLTSSLIVALSYHDKETDKVFRLYSYFKSYLEYGIYTMKLPESERCFYEIILGESTQKPHFDIDIDSDTVKEMVNGEAVKNNLIDAIITVLGSKGVTLVPETDILIFTSHGKTKQSYHLVVNNYCHANNVEASAFYYNVMDHVDKEYVQWIDKAVYNPTQQFRIVGSRKIGSHRVKQFNNEWMYNDKTIVHKYPETPDSPEHEFVMQLEASIVGYTGNCKFLPPFEPQPDQIKHYTESEDVSLDEATQALNLVGAAGKININDRMFPYKFLGINGPIVMLQRIKASRCKICNRIHENENPYLLVVGEEKSVYFHCRRAPDNKKLFLGKLNPEAITSTPTSREPSPEHQKLNNVRVKWSANTVERLQRIARSGSVKDKKFITGSTQIDPRYRKQFIDLYVNSK